MEIMRCKSLILFGLAILLAATANTVLAATETEGLIAEATVNLYCKIETDEFTLNTTGSGVFVDSSGIILTNAHVAQFFLLEDKEGPLQANCRVKTGSPAKESYDAEVLYISNQWLEKNIIEEPNSTRHSTGENDFALLLITELKDDEPSPLFIPLAYQTSFNLYKDQSVFLAGYPSENLKYSIENSKIEQVISRSSVIKAQTFSDISATADIITIDSSEAGQSGSSGGPVTNTDGEIVGIITTKSSSKDDPVIRAITLPYINRTLTADIGLGLGQLLESNLEIRSLVTRLLLPKDFSTSLLNAIEIWSDDIE